MMQPIVIPKTMAEAIPAAIPLQRRSLQGQVVWGQRIVTVGGQAPVRVQSMTNTDTVDVIGTAIQVKELAIAGAEIRSWVEEAPFQDRLEQEIRQAFKTLDAALSYYEKEDERARKKYSTTQIKNCFFRKW
mgnify:CR=1 FL=1